MQPDWPALQEAFHGVTLARGAAYARAGHVVQVDVQAHDDHRYTVTARVQGSEAQPYEVEIDIARPPRSSAWNIDGRCSCPVGYNCKHAAAALIVAFGLSEPRAATHPVAQRSVPAAAAPTPAAPGLGAHGLWIERLRALQAGPAPNTSAPARQRLTYAIEPAAWGARPIVQPMIGTPRKDGSLGSLRSAPSDFAAVLRNRPQYLTEADAALLRALALATEPDGAGRNVMVRDAPLLRRIIEEGRAIVRPGTAYEHLALRCADARCATARWAADDAGRQRFVLQIAPPADAIALEGLWYIDRQRGEFGPLEADVEARVAEVLLSAPPVHPNEVETVATALQQTLPAPVAGAAVPLPARIASREIRDPARVHLRLTNAAVHDHGFATLEGADLFVHVRYGEVPVRLDDNGRPRLHDGELVAPVIDRAVHEKTVNRLRSAGCMELHEANGRQPYESAFFLSEHLVLKLVRETLPRWQRAGWNIEIAPDFAWQIVEPAGFFVEAEPLADDRWFGLELGMDVDGQRLSLLPILTRLLESRDLRQWLLREDVRDTDIVNVRIDAQRIVALPVVRLRTIVRTLIELQDCADTGALKMARTDSGRLAALLDAGFDWRGTQALRQLAQRLARFDSIGEVEPPRELRAELRAYQRAGLAWLQFLREYELAGILADDMGLGKTVQAIAHVLLEKEAGRLVRPALVVAPTSVVHNWQSECARFAPQLRVLVLHGSARRAAFDQIGAHDVVLTTYPLLPRDIETLADQQFHLAIFDEAQNLKNARTRAAEAAGRLRAASRVALTGTPLENNLGELWSQFNLLLPGFLGDRRRFAQLYRTPIEKHGDTARRAHLARRIRPFVLRRTKDMVARELPPKTEIEHAVELAGAQRDLYETVRASMHERVREALARQGLARSHIVVLDALLKLRQVCCDPRLLRGAATSKVRESAKLDRLAELLPELVAEGRRILLFSQFTSMLALIEERLAALAIDYVKLTGDTRDRATPVARFQRGEVALFLISLKAGGTGLNLTAADTVIHYDPWWNPAVENQATDRAHRIGQDKPVFVHRLIAAGTVEERIRELQARKAALARGILDEDAALAAALTAEDLQALFEPLPV